MSSKTKFRLLSKRIGFRLLAILLGLFPLLGFELLLRVSGWQVPPAEFRPVVEFIDPQSLFVLEEDHGTYRIADNRLIYFRPQSFPVKKSSDTVRIFCLGGSTVQGRPYAVETSFTTWLQIALKELAPQQNWEVVNCGGVSYASYRLLPILEEVLDYEPDLILLYTGHNEFLEARTFEQLKPIRENFNFLPRLMTSMRTVEFFNQFQSRDDKFVKPLQQLPSEVDAILDYERGVEYYQRNPIWRQGVQDQFADNVRKMVTMCLEEKVPLFLYNPVRNLRDCPPFKSMQTAGLTNEQLHQVDSLRSQLQLNPELAITLLTEMLSVNPDDANFHYLLAQEYLENQELALAFKHFEMACDEDLCPLRILSPMQEVLTEIATEYDVPLIDIAEYFAELSPTGIPGDNLLLDHVHPTIAGHQQIALKTLKTFAHAGYLTENPDQETRKHIEKKYLRNLRSLDTAYFENGRQRLNNLQAWAAGRGDKIRKQAP
ncbi:SGNH/GDSL hydrolase family protein [uncultured Rubinisphaera sp.]|uniref:SGNH/GDSL hydrolase family protein n=1 Tax=uncultured Rubinisphaera sp. TaxID=1678686 RepID=UPI0030D7404C